MEVRVIDEVYERDWDCSGSKGWAPSCMSLLQVAFSHTILQPRVNKKLYWQGCKVARYWVLSFQTTWYTFPGYCMVKHLCLYLISILYKWCVVVCGKDVHVIKSRHFTFLGCDISLVSDAVSYVSVSGFYTEMKEYGLEPSEILNNNWVRIFSLF